jgi:hypothetical protein
MTAAERRQADFAAQLCVVIVRFAEDHAIYEPVEELCCADGRAACCSATRARPNGAVSRLDIDMAAHPVDRPRNAELLMHGFDDGRGVVGDDDVGRLAAQLASMIDQRAADEFDEDVFDVELHLRDAARPDDSATFASKRSSSSGNALRSGM